MKTRPELERDYLASEARYKELVQQTLSADASKQNEELVDLEKQRRSALRETNRILGQLQADLSEPSHEALRKQVQFAERDIDAIEAKIENADDSTTYPSDYAAMRHEQEQRRQDILKCQSDMKKA